MALFSGSSAKEPGHPPVAEGSLSIIARGTKIVGDVESEGVVKIEGEVKGSVRAARQVLVGKGGKLEGDLVAREAIVGGEVRGSIAADERVELQATSLVIGDITTKRLLVQEGSRLDGATRMTEAAQGAAAKGRQPGASVGTQVGVRSAAAS